MRKKNKVKKSNPILCQKASTQSFLIMFYTCVCFCFCLSVWPGTKTNLSLSCHQHVLIECSLVVMTSQERRLPDSSCSTLPAITVQEMTDAYQVGHRTPQTHDQTHNMCQVHVIFAVFFCLRCKKTAQKFDSKQCEYKHFKLRES